MISKKCVVCGKEFFVYPSRKDTAKACSNECAVIVRAKSRERKAVCTCENCGKVFEVPRSHVARRVYCSKKCQYASDRFRTEQQDRMAGDKNPRWCGGETNHSGGYIYKRAMVHPYSSNGYVFKHRLVMEEWLKKDAPDSEYLVKLGDNLYLSPDYSVHHLDWDKKNNRRRNLLVCSSSVHGKLHNGTYPEAGTYWPETAKIKLGNNNLHISK